ncbi:MAG: hypothetical protein ABS46_20295 [Cytophagaceae bacterium SCN 52-12]|nr:MAG: hypothetical protein ABS46_20295 [Cytophagaceae bacterium SCN 52-12]
MLFFFFSGYGQETAAPQVETQFGALKTQYEKGALSKARYLHLADSLLISFFTGGTYFERSELEGHLSLFKDIAWSEEEFGMQRINYFEHFMNNALMQSKGGEAIYFSEKVSREITGDPHRKSLVELFTKCIFYIKNKNHAKAATFYKEEADLIRAYPESLKAGKVSADEALKAMHLLSIIITPYIELNDTTEVLNTVNTAERLSRELKPLVSDDKEKVVMTQILLNSMRYSSKIFLRDYPGAKAELLATRELLDGEKGLAEYVSVAAEYNLLEWWISYYLETKDNANAAAYLERYAATPPISEDYSSTLNTFRARLKANEGYYREAYDIMVTAGKDKDELYARMMNELDDLLYSHTASEMSQIALQQAETEKKRQTTWIVIISVLAVGALAAAYLRMQREKRKSAEIVARLNQEANLQIAILEEEKRQASRKEQERIGMELHDGLSASMAALLYQVGDVAAEIPEASRKLIEVQRQMEQVYQAVRSKSHYWHDSSGDGDGVYFQQQVEKLTQTLPDARYAKEIEIDSEAVRSLGLNQRVEILRIVQEAVTNILKHARASVVNIFLYKKGGETVLHISDNGKGFDPEKVKARSGLGLKSISERAARLNGRMEISSGKEGSSLEISFAG